MSECDIVEVFSSGMGIWPVFRSRMKVVWTGKGERYDRVVDIIRRGDKAFLYIDRGDSKTKTESFFAPVHVMLKEAKTVWIVQPDGAKTIILVVSAAAAVLSFIAVSLWIAGGIL